MPDKIYGLKCPKCGHEWRMEKRETYPPCPNCGIPKIEETDKTGSE